MLWCIFEVFVTCWYVWLDLVEVVMYVRVYVYTCFYVSACVLFNVKVN
jgi:hypothetical protein